MDHIRNLMRLQRFYGAVASEQNRFILQRVIGEQVLELGCGYGTFVYEAIDAGKKAIGLDIDFETLQKGSSAYPSLSFKLVQGDMVRLPFRDKSFHTVILRESLHHVAWEKVLPEILRICKKEIFIFEPNPNWLLRFCRKVIAHQDLEIPLHALLNQLERHGILIKEIHYRDLFAFPLSGGFVGWEFVPSVEKVYPFLLKVDKIFQFFSHLFGVEKKICWRYLIKGVLRESEVPK
jgi:ubiquinone/menaquinone biosynthesis C-methylase UbiE